VNCLFLWHSTTQVSKSCGRLQCRRLAGQVGSQSLDSAGSTVSEPRIVTGNAYSRSQSPGPPAGCWIVGHVRSLARPTARPAPPRQRRGQAMGGRPYRGRTSAPPRASIEVERLINEDLPLELFCQGLNIGREIAPHRNTRASANRGFIIRICTFGCDGGGRKNCESHLHLRAALMVRRRAGGFRTT
jgi:hypothetical protein